MTKVSMTVNGRPMAAEIEGRTLLVDFLREGLGHKLSSASLEMRNLKLTLTGWQVESID